MTPSEKEKIIKEGFDAIRKVYNLRDDLLEDAGKLEAVRESNRKLSDRVANLEVTIKTLNAAIDKKDVEIKRLREELELLQKVHVKLCSDYNKLNKALTEELEAEKYKSEIDELESNFHELREQISHLYLYYLHDVLQLKDVTAFTHWFTETFGDFGINDEEE